MAIPRGQLGSAINSIGHVPCALLPLLFRHFLKVTNCLKFDCDKLRNGDGRSIFAAVDDFQIGAIVGLYLCLHPLGFDQRCRLDSDDRAERLKKTYGAPRSQVVFDAMA